MQRPLGLLFTGPNDVCNSPRSITAVLSASGSAVHLPKFHYTTVHTALQEMALSEADIFNAPLLPLFSLLLFSSVKQKGMEIN